MSFVKIIVLFLVIALASGCASQHASYDYTAYKNSDPHSILVLPPINNSSEVIAPYAVLANATKPLAESGYYVMPVALVAETFKNNGLTIAQDIHAVAPQKLHDIFGADAALYIDIKEYGTSYAVISSDTIVEVSARLVDLETSTLLWQGKASASSGEQRDRDIDNWEGMLVSAILNQVIETATDKSFKVSQTATQRLLSANHQNGLLYGPRSPKYNIP
ncbi:Putative lipoprotein/NMB1162 [Pseudoalteromonas holothuriae]|uniref:Lipoprotein/NMB1162 n=1 Tax=Pseudoalteromonas holothuriae TaxID=2963714 RepID=A0A9W4QW79_9GAMM|nr:MULTISPECIES: DUF799 domain-containing protein [unclassified Pseudoalteromonas]CAH9055521.1 Putative lipoprotein/NMB1162 [Pseudoalteromonas sp. CIP111854]CAH9063015.1 Putative lipoprotein/NMB1162 [Pseudoalteromonas sp. CIP111951]